MGTADQIMKVIDGTPIQTGNQRAQSSLKAQTHPHAAT